MTKILFIVESPGKVAKISQMLGSQYIVKASVGHFRDLNPKNMSIDFENNFEPQYIITKPDVVKNLRAVSSKVDMVYLATDMDLEGHAIAQHLLDVLKPKTYKRIVFNAITKPAITDAIQRGGLIDTKSVSAQKARRVLDRLYGYSVSKILSSHLGPKLSAGRVQSVAVRLVVDKEVEIRDFLTVNGESTFFKVNGTFDNLSATLFVTKDPDTDDAYEGKIAQINLDDTETDAYATIRTCLRRCSKSSFTIRSVSTKEIQRQPPPPFETATLQQEANNRFRMSVDTTMKTAQKLYEGGYITYMRTDSVSIAPDAHKAIKKAVIDNYGSKYYRRFDYETKSTNAQEAHEAIRPTDPSIKTLDLSDKNQNKLYKLIWQRTIASQMQPARVAITTIQIDISRWLKYKYDPFYYFQSQIEKILFDGYLAAYTEAKIETNNEDITCKSSGPVPKVGKKIAMKQIVAKQEYRKPPLRYTEASLVNILKKLGIGRPSTYVNTIKTVMTRGYIEIGSTSGISKSVAIMSVKPQSDIVETQSVFVVGKETNKLMATDLGSAVNTWLSQNFTEMLDYKFTAKIESQLDAITSGTKIWHKVVKDFYSRLTPNLEKLATTPKPQTRATDRLLGSHKGTEIYACRTKYGPAVKKLSDDRTIYVKLGPKVSLDKITLDEAIKLFAYPKSLGNLAKKEIMLHKGAYGFYLVYDNQSYQLVDSSKAPTKELAISTIKAKQSSIIQTFDLTIKRSKVIVSIIKGKYGPYVQTVAGKKKTNHPLPRHLDPAKVTAEQIKGLLEKQSDTKRSSSKTRSTKKQRR